MKIGDGTKKELEPYETQCVPCGHVWTLKPQDPLRCPQCGQAYFRTPPQKVPST